MSFPLTVSELLEALETWHPEPVVNPTDSLAKIMFDAGRRSVVLDLLRRRELDAPPVLREARGQGRVRRQDPKNPGDRRL